MGSPQGVSSGLTLTKISQIVRGALLGKISETFEITDKYGYGGGEVIGEGRDIWEALNNANSKIYTSDTLEGGYDMKFIRGKAYN